MTDVNCYPVWKPYTPETANGQLRFEAGTYQMVVGRWERLENGSVQEFINQVHKERTEAILPTNTIIITIGWTSRPYEGSEDIDG